MRFHLLDRLDEILDDRLVATKVVTQAEEYLADHFPTFPVLPGVLMLEAATQACAWLVFRRAGLMEPTDYTGPTVAVLKSARNVRYGHFVAPGRSLRVTADYVKSTDAGHQFKIEGTVDVDAGRTAITGKLELACFRLDTPADTRLIESHRDRWTNLTATRKAV
jgi:3-hydroxyacyl-[acyl-carrier-protein] dehydratase